MAPVTSLSLLVRRDREIGGSILSGASGLEKFNARKHVLIGLLTFTDPMVGNHQSARKQTELTLSSPAQNTNSASGLLNRMRLTISPLLTAIGRTSRFFLPTRTKHTHIIYPYGRHSYAASTCGTHLRWAVCVRRCSQAGPGIVGIEIGFNKECTLAIQLDNRVKATHPHSGSLER